MLFSRAGSGGCFPMHFDSDAMLDGRRVTAIIYLNDAWTPGCGGELRLYPFPAPPVNVAPVADRLCLFASTSMLHR
jgi:Rps23 Pro-64 3,4-dihydroxylase Tpa1-like proline 4-hydroxylase